MAKLETGTEQLLCEIDSGVATITLNRPEKRNALSDILTPALRETLLIVDKDPTIRCVVLTGAGRAFCAGGDISDMNASSNASATERSHEDAVAELFKRQETLSLRLHEMRTPSIAALPGPAAGAGFSIALACDIRIMAQSAFITPAFANIGLAGDYGGSWFLTQLIGPSKAKMLYYTSPKLQSNECLELGIVNEVVTDKTLQLRALEIAAAIAAGPPIALSYMKAHINAASDADLRTTLALEAEHTIRCMRTEDHKEAAQAFMEKRRPVFVGK